MEQTPPRLRVIVPAFALTRTVLNTGARMIYPFLPAFSRGLGVPPEAIALAVTARAALGLGGPLFGALADRQGRRGAMLTGLALFSAAMLLVTLWPTYPAFFGGLVLAAAGKIIVDASVLAYMGDRVPYAQRGRAIAITELGWSGAFLLGMPLVAWLITRWGWAGPFPVLAVAGVLSALMLWRLLPRNGPGGSEVRLPTGGGRLLLAHPAALAALGVGLLISLGNEMVSIVFGEWLEASFALRVAALGTASAVIGVAELGGEGLVAAVADRLGIKRSIALGLALNALAALALPLVGRSVFGALAGLFAFYITFEFTLVSSIPLITELLPAARAFTVAANVAAISVGRMLGALAGVAIFRAGIGWNGAATALADALALALLVALVRVE